ncbi:hypothetical protein CRENBAI_021842 [Crenichthys baileyi]|uniref:Uncharacterized protein n=1 Tax=Crenichthys baileyi TaxID=28760 RepID=A0AAV9RI30_9TELE
MDAGGVSEGFGKYARHRSPFYHPGLSLLPMNNVADPLPSGRPGMPPYQAVLEEEVSNLASLGSDASQPPQTIPTLIPNLQRGVLGSKMLISTHAATGRRSAAPRPQQQMDGRRSTGRRKKSILPCDCLHQKTIRTPSYIRKKLLGGGNEGSSRQHIKLAPSELTLAVAAILHAVYPTPQAWRQIGVYIGFSPSSLSAG